MTRTCALLFASLVLLTGGCSGTDTDPSRSPGDEASPDADAIRSGLAALFAGDHPSARDTRDGACFAGALMERTTPEDLQDAGVLDTSYAVAAEQPLHLHAGCVPRHQHHRVPAVPVGVRVGEPHEHEDLAVRVADSGRPPLAAVDHHFSRLS